MKKQFRLLAMAALLVLPLAACDEGDDTPLAPTVTGSVTGTVTVDGTGQAGVTVTLSNGKTATTSATGQFTISDVPAGAYTATITGYPTDVSFPATTQAAVIATSGQVVVVNFPGSRIRTSSIQGSVTTTGGVGLTGVTVTLSGTESRTATTAAGQYAITGLRAGTYTVAITTVPTGNTCAVTSQSVTVAAGESKVASFTCTTTVVNPGTGTITGRLFTDANGDSVLTAGEPTLALSGVWVRLEGPTIGVKDSVKTVDGVYTFASKPAGTYNVSVDPNDATFGNAGVTMVGTSSKAVTLAAGGTATANFGFATTSQRINVYAYLGRDANAATGVSTSIGTDVKPAPGVVIALYADQASADIGGTTGRIGLDTTDAKGEAQFSFLRSADTGPGAVTDQIVFAKYISNPSGYQLNGETQIEIRYNPIRQPDMAPDTFDLLNPTVTMKVDVLGTGTKTPLAGWNVNLYTDTTGAPISTTTTDALGRAVFSQTVPSVMAADLPKTFYLGMTSSQAAAFGHGFTFTSVAEQGTVATRYIAYTYTGTRAAGDTVDVGDQLVKFSDADVWVRVHHEADDTLAGGKPVYSGGDNFTNVSNIQVTLRYTNSAGTVVTLGPIVPNNFDGYTMFPNVPTGRAPYILAATSTTANQFVLEEDTLFTVGQGTFMGDLSGGTFTTIICPLGRTISTASCSTFAEKQQDNTINITVRDQTGTINADSVKIRVRSDPRTIQPKPTDTLLTVSRGGIGGMVSLTGIRDGYYIVSVLHDSINAAGDTVWAFRGTANNTVTVDAQGPADVDNVSFVASRGDTQIQGFVVNDRDQDFNTVDPGEGLSGVTISLYRDNVGTITLDTLVKTVTTDANGAYSFSGLREGTYAVRAVSPTGAIVLRRFSGTGAVVDTAIVTTTAAAVVTCQITNNARRVGSNDPSCYSSVQPLPSWNYATSTAQNVNPASFTFLVSTGTVTGLIRKADLTAVAGMTVTLRRCLTSSAPNTPTAGTCGSYDTSYAAVTAVTDATGKYTFSSLREGVYEAMPNPASVTGFSSTTPPAILSTINDPNDVETGNFTANP